MRWVRVGICVYPPPLPTMPIMSPCGGLLTYRTSRSIRIDVWQLGLAFRLIQAMIVGMVAYDIFQRDGWAYSEVPAGRVNAYGESTAEFVSLGTTTPACVTAIRTWEPPIFAARLTPCSPRALSDCSSADHDYVFSNLWSYIKPECRKLGVAEIYNKNKDSVSFTTSIIESVEYASQHGQSAPWQRSARLLRLLWARLAALHGSRRPGREVRSLSAQPLP